MQETNLDVKAFWVKKRMKAKEWNDFYSQALGYCFLEKGDGGVIAGFLVANKVPFDCEEQSEMDLIKMQEYLEATSTYPRPFKTKNDEQF
jgi:hypothetical protein